MAMRELFRRVLGNRRDAAHAAIRGLRGRARVAVLTVVDDELKQLQQALRCTNNLAGTAYWVREKLPSTTYEVVLKQLADRGNIASGECASEIIEDFRPHYLLLVGIGGGIEGRDDMGIGDVVIADHVDYYEFRKLMDGKSMSRKIPLDHPSRLLRCDIAKPMSDMGHWTSAIALKRPIDGVCKAIVGNLIAGEKLLADGSSAIQRDILEEYDKAIAVDMESVGVARAVFKARGSVHYNLQYAVVRGVSDLVDADDNDGMRRQWRPYAASAAAAFAAGMIERLLEIPT
jgi:nucleoside phosphorylase